MRYYAWYSPEINVIIFQVIMQDCYIAFAWKHSDMCEHLNLYDDELNVGDYLWVPLGEL